MKRTTVMHYQRRPRPTGHFSLEIIFDDVRTRLGEELRFEKRIAPCYSSGVLPRMRILFDAWWHQQGITHVTGDINFAAILLRRNTTILTVLDCGDWVARRDWRSRLLKLFWLALPVRKAVRVTTISEASKRDIIALTGCRGEKIEVIPVAISERYNRVDREFNGRYPTILQIGCASNKNIERLAAGLEGIPCKLRVIGALSEAQHSALCKANVDYDSCANLSEEELCQCYIECDIVTFASTYEGFGMPIVEAQTVGRVVVTSNCSSMPEVAGEGACLVNPFDVSSIRSGIQRVIQDAQYRERLLCAGYENAKRFNGEAIARQYLNIYKQVIANPNGSKVTYA